MNCHAARAELNALVDREWTAGVSSLARTARHCLACRKCRALWKELLRQRRLTRSLSGGAAPTHLREQVLARLHSREVAVAGAGAGGTSWTKAPQPTWQRTRALKLAATGALVVVVGAVAVYTSLPSRAENAAEAIARVNTWHLSGWKLDPNGVRTPWEVWGRRKPFLYREQIGTQVLLDDGQARLHLLPVGHDRQLAVRTRSLQSLDDARWTRLTVGTEWKDAEPFRAEAQQVVYQWTDSGMQGPGSVGHDYFFVDRATWLPTRWEYREGRGEKETTVSSLDVEYDVPIPDGMDSARPPAGAQVVDALAAPDKPLPVRNTEQAGGVTAQATPIKLDPNGNVLVQLRAWLGTAAMGQGSLAFYSGLPIWARTVDGQRHQWAITDNRGRPYVLMQSVQIGGMQPDLLPDGSRYLWFAPLEPLRPGEPLPEALTLNITVTPFVMLEGGSHNLMHQDLRWIITLSTPGGEVRMADFAAALAHSNVRVQEEVPVAATLAATRSHAYECQSDYPNAIRWMRLAILACRPDSNQGQFYRLNLAAQYRRSKRHSRSDATLREVIETKARYPKTSSYYAENARQTLQMSPRKK